MSTLFSLVVCLGFQSVNLQYQMLLTLRYIRWTPEVYNARVQMRRSRWSMDNTTQLQADWKTILIQNISTLSKLIPETRDNTYVDQKSMLTNAKQSPEIIQRHHNFTSPQLPLQTTKCVHSFHLRSAPTATKPYSNAFKLPVPAYSTTHQLDRTSTEVSPPQSSPRASPTSIPHTHSQTAKWLPLQSQTATSSSSSSHTPTSKSVRTPYSMQALEPSPEGNTPNAAFRCRVRDNSCQLTGRIPR